MYTYAFVFKLSLQHTQLYRKSHHEKCTALTFKTTFQSVASLYTIIWRLLLHASTGRTVTNITTQYYCRIFWNIVVIALVLFTPLVFYAPSLKFLCSFGDYLCPRWLLLWLPGSCISFLLLLLRIVYIVYSFVFLNGSNI